MCDYNHQYYILCSFSNELRPLQPLGYQNVGTGIAFEGREMANKTNEVLLHMQSQSNKIKIIKSIINQLLYLAMVLKYIKVHYVGIH